MPNNSFSKSHHLCSYKDITALYRSGSKSQSVYPLRAVARFVERREGPRVQVLVSVSKRHFKHAVDRNRVKRQMREVYRLHRALLWDRVPEDKTLHIALMWIGDRKVKSDYLTQRFLKLADHIMERLLPTPPIELEKQE